MHPNGKKSYYGAHEKRDQLTAFGRCIGHSGMPVVIGKNGQLFFTKKWMPISKR